MRLTVAAKAPATRDHVRGISGLSAPPNSTQWRIYDTSLTTKAMLRLSPRVYIPQDSRDCPFLSHMPIDYTRNYILLKITNYLNTKQFRDRMNTYELLFALINLGVAYSAKLLVSSYKPNSEYETGAIQTLDVLSCRLMGSHMTAEHRPAGWTFLPTSKMSFASTKAQVAVSHLRVPVLISFGS
jgi:hypothetical protein